jgi:dTMP kinase
VARGKLITIEGLDGAGKSTLASSLVESLGQRGLQVAFFHEPGGVPLADRIGRLVRDPALSISGRAEALLYAAARAELVSERVAPLLLAGTWVLLDRHLDSSLAYQGAGRGLSVEEVRAVSSFATAGLVPDRTLLLRVAPAVGRARLRARGLPSDRLEREQLAFFESVAAAYDRLAAAEPRRIRSLDAEQPPGRVLDLALAELGDLLA